MKPLLIFASRDLSNSQISPCLEGFLKAFLTDPSLDTFTKNTGRMSNAQLFLGRVHHASSSALSLIYVYNLLPQGVVDAVSVASFQRKLSSALVKACERELHNWPLLLQSGARRLSVDSFQRFFFCQRAA